MPPVFEWMAAHPTFSTLAAYYLFSCLVSGMPQPTAQNGLGYVWLYNSLHALAANVLGLLMKKTNGLIPAATATKEPS